MTERTQMFTKNNGAQRFFKKFHGLYYFKKEAFLETIMESTVEEPAAENITVDLSQQTRHKSCLVFFVKHADNSADFHTDFQVRTKISRDPQIKFHNLPYPQIFKAYHDKFNQAKVEMIDEAECLLFEKQDLEKHLSIFVFEKFDMKITAFKYISDMETI
jgi:hypothetical protein